MEKQKQNEMNRRTEINVDILYKQMHLKHTWKEDNFLPARLIILNEDRKVC